MSARKEEAPYVEGQVNRHGLAKANNYVQMGCKHRRGVVACGGCFARLHYAIRDAIELLVEGRAADARARLELTKVQSMADPKAVRR